MEKVLALEHPSIPVSTNKLAGVSTCDRDEEAKQLH
jgi:hypothetical protein